MTTVMAWNSLEEAVVPWGIRARRVFNHRKVRCTVTDVKLDLELPPFMAAESVDTESERKDSEFNTSVVYSCCYYP